ncbi:hypothetical protein [Flavobacterium sp. WG21]|uniref:hypothetical protein n=1 Tax=Flavobacterium sp. WG21 TaxID=1229487 RepID=UPI000349D284|nr:hypothetical protein [Flavobacterium sp. WG21]
MNLNEKKIAKLIGILILVLSLTIIFFYIKNGYKSFGLYVIPIVFVVVSGSIIFKENISRWVNGEKMIQSERWMMKHSRLVFFILPLSIFSIIGFLVLFLAIKLKWDVDLLGWITVSLFAFLPLILIYGLLFGFSISEKQQREIEKRQDKLFSDDQGITIEMPLFEKSCFISWQSIDTIIYYNYTVNSDFTEYYEGYMLYLNVVPIYTKYEKQWWLNKLFPKDPQSKIIDVNNETKYFLEMPKMVEKYLNTKAEINFRGPMKDRLILSQTYKSKNKITTIKKWKPGNDVEEQIVFDKFNRSVEKIKKNYC